MKPRGFTLLEVLVATLIMGLLLVGTLTVIGNSIDAHGRVARETTLLPLAESKMDEILKEPLIQQGKDKGDFGEELSDYQWEATIEPSTDETLLSIQIRVFPTDHPEQAVSLTCLRRPEIGPVEPDDTNAPTASGSVL